MNSCNHMSLAAYGLRRRLLWRRPIFKVGATGRPVASHLQKDGATGRWYGAKGRCDNTSTTPQDNKYQRDGSRGCLLEPSNALSSRPTRDGSTSPWTEPEDVLSSRLFGRLEETFPRVVRRRQRTFCRAVQCPLEPSNFFVGRLQRTLERCQRTFSRAVSGHTAR